MITDRPTGLRHDWQQYFPTYNYTDKEILLKEYEACARTVETAERMYLNATNIVLISFTVFSAILSGYINIRANDSIGNWTKEIPVIAILFVVFFSYITTKYFADRQRSIVFDSRKIVVLRRMLGLSYGNQTLVLPAWRLEGADNPFAIRFFPGWRTYVCYPFFVVSIASFLFLSVIVPEVLPRFISDLSEGLPLLLSACWFIILAYAFRTSLYDQNENLLLSIAKIIAFMLRIRLATDIEYRIYRARLAVFETSRQRVDIDKFKVLLVAIEDRTFFQHHGLSARAMIRAAYAYFRYGKRSGASTITQQLSRTLFVIDIHKTIRRKIVEMLLAPWMEMKFSKNDILEMHIASVRYERAVTGVLDAMKYFFGKITPLTLAQSYFLIERVSNVRSRVLANKIHQQLNKLRSDGLLSKEDMSEVWRIYESQVAAGRLTQV